MATTLAEADELLVELRDPIGMLTARSSLPAEGRGELLHRLSGLAKPPQADLGSMLGEGRKVLINASHVAAIPGLAVFLIVMSMNLIGDWLFERLTR